MHRYSFACGRSAFFLGLLISVSLANAATTPSTPEVTSQPLAPESTPQWRKDPLKPEQLRSLRRIGRALLIAKQGEKSDPELAAFHRDMQALTVELDQALLKASMPSVVTSKQNTPVSIRDDNLHTDTVAMTNFSVDKEGRISHQKPTPMATSIRPHQVVWHPLVDKTTPSQNVAGVDDPYLTVRQHISQTQAHLKHYMDVEQERGGEERHIQATAVSTKIQQLHSEIQEALDLPASENAQRIAKLSRIKERLESGARTKPHEDGSDASDITPTFSVVTYHR